VDSIPSALTTFRDLRKAGADVNAQNSLGTTTLMFLGQAKRMKLQLEVRREFSPAGMRRDQLHSITFT
jgi:hypothetical protein